MLEDRIKGTRSSSIQTTSFIFLHAVLSQSIANNIQLLAPDDAKQATYAISSKASMIIDPLDARTLANDQSFIETLNDVIGNDEFTDADKADAFLLMRMKFDWALPAAARSNEEVGRIQLDHL